MKIPQNKTLIATAIALAFASPSYAQRDVWPHGKPWKPRQTLNMQAGHGWEDDYDMLLPLMGNNKKLFFANGGIAGSRHYSGGDIGFGYRQLVNRNRYVLSGYALLGRYRGNYDNMFTQATIGLESLSRIWDARAHAYIPVGNKRGMISSTATNLHLTGHKAVGGEIDIVETAQDGFDIELGRPIPHHPELRAFVGYYHYGFGGRDNWDGAQIRAEYRYNNYVTFTASEKYDHRFGNRATIGVRFSLGALKLHRYDAVDRMTEYLYRQRGILTTQATEDGTFVSPENFYYANNQAAPGGDGTFERPYLTVNDAEAAALDGNPATNYVYIYGDASATDYQVGPLTVGANQIFMGSNGDLIYRGQNLLPSNGYTPTLLGSLVANSHDEIAFLNLSGDNNTINGNGGIYADGVDHLNLHNLSIFNYEAAGGADGVNGANGVFNPSDQNALNGQNGTNGENGFKAYGIDIRNSSDIIISGINISNLTGGNGGFGGIGGDGADSANNVRHGGDGGNGGIGGSGGDAVGISILNSTNIQASGINVSNLTAGNGQNGGAGGIGGNAKQGPGELLQDGGNGGSGGSGGNGGSAIGLALENSTQAVINGFTASGTFSAGTGGSGSVGRNGGDGGGSINIGNTGQGGNGGDGGSGGNGGNAYAYSSINSSAATSNMTYTATLNSGTGGTLATAGLGGPGSADAGSPNGTDGTDGTNGSNGSTGNTHIVP